MADEPRPVTTHTLLKMKEKAERIVMLTCYDALFARLLDASGVDALLVGDSVNQVLAGSGAPALRLKNDAQALEDAGAFAIVLELVPAPRASEITKSLTIPTIGIGAGPACDGQVLVLHDMLGLNERFSAKFVKKYASLADDVREAVSLYAAEVREGRYPGPEHSFGHELPPTPPPPPPPLPPTVASR